MIGVIFICLKGPQSASSACLLISASSQHLQQQCNTSQNSCIMFYPLALPSHVNFPSSFNSVAGMGRGATSPGSALTGVRLFYRFFFFFVVSFDIMLTRGRRGKGEGEARGRGIGNDVATLVYDTTLGHDSPVCIRGGEMTREILFHIERILAPIYVLRRVGEGNQRKAVWDISCDSITQQND